MAEINIAPYIKELLIFDDPKYCDNGIRKCKFMVEEQCRIFNDWEDCEGDYYRKSNACKKAYLRGKKIIEDEEAIEIANQYKNGEREAVTQEELDALLKNGFIEIAEED